MDELLGEFHGGVLEQKARSQNRLQGDRWSGQILATRMLTVRLYGAGKKEKRSGKLKGRFPDYLMPPGR